MSKTKLKNNRTLFKRINYSGNKKICNKAAYNPVHGLYCINPVILGPIYYRKTLINACIYLFFSCCLFLPCRFAPLALLFFDWEAFDGMTFLS